jgi:DHA1 family bicyclomycin/chloramphenicol resistance-like MFS transporter
MPRPKTKKDFIFLILALGAITAIGPLTVDIYLPAFNAITSDLGGSERLIQLSLTTYFLGITFGQISYGPIIDRFGKKPPLFFGLSLFLLASIGCYFCVTIEQLIILRFFQAFGACAGGIVPRSIVRDIFSTQESARVFSRLALVMGLAPILAPLIGNLILAKFSWRVIFAFLASFSVFCLLICWRAIPETAGANRDEKISKAFRKYWGILHDSKFVISALSGGFMMGGLFSYVTGSPAIYMDFFALDSGDYGKVLSINALGFVTASQVNARFLKRFSLDSVLQKTIFIPLLVGVSLAFCPANFYCVTGLFFLFICSCGMIFPNTTASALANHAKHSGSASALLGTIQFAIAAISSFLVSKFYDGDISVICLVVGSCGILACLTRQLFLINRT